jgi:hypothetical protein
MKTKLHLFITALLFGFAMNAQTVTITGTGTGGWTQPGAVALTSTDGVVFTASNFEIVNDGQLKFSENGSWGTTYGSATAPGFPAGTGTLTSAVNIVGTLGFWNVTYNFTTKDYAFTPGVNPNAIIKINGGGLTSDVQMSTLNGSAYNKKSVTFPGGNAKFIQEGTSNEWGGAFPDGPVVTGELIPVPAGTFNVYFTKNTLVAPAEYVFEPTVISMIGNFVGSGWGADIDFETADNVNFTKTNYTFTPNGTDTVIHMKIRDNHDWSFQFGVPVANVSATSGTLITTNAEDLTLPPGIYNVAFNRSTYEYSFTLLGSNPVIKLSGTAIGATDVNLITTDGSAYTKQSVACVVGTAKFIEDGTSNQWSSASFPSGTGTQEGSLIPLTEAAYNVSFTKSTGAYSFDHVTVSMVGGFNNWGGSADIDMTSTDGISFAASNQVFATSTELKFRDNHDWANAFGSTVNPSAFPSGTGTTVNSSNIAVPAGTYNITFNRNTLAYSFADLSTNSFTSTKFNVYPNPTSSTWNFVSNNNSQIKTIQIVDMLGKVVLTKNTTSNEVAVDASNLNTGIYFARIATATAIETVKLVKN